MRLLRPNNNSKLDLRPFDSDSVLTYAHSLILGTQTGLTGVYQQPISRRTEFSPNHLTVDCIDKLSSAELTEAVNSVFY
jgi:hypothetical protein